MKTFQLFDEANRYLHAVFEDAKANLKEWRRQEFHHEDFPIVPYRIILRIYQEVAHLPIFKLYGQEFAFYEPYR